MDHQKHVHSIAIKTEYVSMASASVQAKRPSQLLVSIHQASLLAQQEALQTPVNTKNT